MNSGTLIKEDHSPVIDLSWGGGMGSRSGRNDRVGARWSGFVQLEAGQWKFGTRSDDGSNLYIDD
jgi:hypothetical protein